MDKPEVDEPRRISITETQRQSEVGIELRADARRSTLRLARRALRRSSRSSQAFTDCPENVKEMELTR